MPLLVPSRSQIDMEFFGKNLIFRRPGACFAVSESLRDQAQVRETLEPTRQVSLAVRPGQDLPANIPEGCKEFDLDKWLDQIDKGLPPKTPLDDYVTGGDC